MNAMTLNMTAAATAAMGGNSAGAMDILDKELARLGRESVNTSRPAMAIALIDAASVGLIGEKDVPARYDAYLGAREKKMQGNVLAAGVEDGNGRKANISKLVQIVKAAQLIGDAAPFQANAVVTLRGNMIGGDDKVHAPYECLLNVARAQIKKGAEELTQDELVECIRKDAPAEKDALAKLVAAYKTTYKLNTDLALPGTEVALQGYADAIVELGGELPPMTKEEKKEAEAMAFLAKRGRI